MKKVLGRAGVVFVVVGLAVAVGCDDGSGSTFVPGRPGEGSSSGDPPPFGGAPTDASAPPQEGTCGNASVDPGETCDDGNAASGDGCSATCEMEPGYACDTPGAACVAAACGDAIVAGDEDCDDGNTQDGDGCSAVCVLEPGFACTTPGAPCFRTVCGDGKREGTEQCDDGNVRPYDGCSPTCEKEPKCSGGSCTAVCGDGVKFPDEACDDGNTRDGDGCSAACKLEPGFECTVATSDLPASIEIPIIYRDFTPATNPDFESFATGVVTGLVGPALGPDDVPTLASTGNPQAITSAASFSEWYRDTPGTNEVILDALTLTKNASDAYVYDNSSFFPLDGKGFGNYASSGHNFHFTSELRYWFTFKGGETLTFRGDDDVWVFINGKLAVDIGGVHGAEERSITLDPATAASLGLTVDKMYQVDLFQAERHTTQSNYKLTLGGFVKARTSCTAVCGDGIKTKGEACDDGVNEGGYGKCAPGCVLGPRCGDGILQREHGETCDDGNLVDGDGCSSTCKGTVVR